MSRQQTCRARVVQCFWLHNATGMRSMANSGPTRIRPDFSSCMLNNQISNCMGLKFLISCKRSIWDRPTTTIRINRIAIHGSQRHWHENIHDGRAF